MAVVHLLCRPGFVECGRKSYDVRWSEELEKTTCSNCKRVRKRHERTRAYTERLGRR